MFKALLLIIVLLGTMGLGYWYGYNNGKNDSITNSDGKSLETKTTEYMERIRSVDIKYKDNDGNIIIPKVEWEKIKKDNNVRNSD